MMCTLRPQASTAVSEGDLMLVNSDIKAIMPFSSQMWNIADILLTEDFPQTMLTFAQCPLQEDQNLEKKRTKNELLYVAFQT